MVDKRKRKIRKEEEEKNEEEEKALFDDNLKKAHKLAVANRWKEFKEIMMKNQENLLNRFDLLWNTSIHMATRSDDPELLRELIGALPNDEVRQQALLKKNFEGNTILHEIVFCKKVQMADVVFEFEEKLHLPQNLLDLQNRKHETPLFRAAKYGNLQMLQHMANHYKGEDIRKHWHSFGKYSALHASVIGEYFDVALWLVKKDNRLAKEKDNEGFTSLQLLCKMPHVFRSQTTLRPDMSFIYHLLPDKGWEIENGKSLQLTEHGTDLESGQTDERKFLKLAISRINHLWKQLAKCTNYKYKYYCFWKFLAKAFEGIDYLWQKKKKHMLADELAEVLVQSDLSWQKSYHLFEKTMIAMPSLPFDVPKKRRQIESKREEKKSNLEPLKYNYTPLLIAASTGIVEIVEKILNLNPEAISHVSNNKQNILHMAIKHRQEEIFMIIERENALPSLVSQITKKGRTILHQVARMDYYRAGRVPGVAFQLQEELLWYQRVRRIIPPNYYMHCDEDGATAEDVLVIEHHEMLESAQKWLKETTQSCSTVAVLVATVVFTAAYTIPGGTEGGTPVFLHYTLFEIFIITDIVALSTSLASVVTFLSIITSPSELWDFHVSLPQKLNLAFALLFWSLVSTMIAFWATILLTFRLGWKSWTVTYSVVFFLVIVIAISQQFPVFVVPKLRQSRLVKHITKITKTIHQLLSSYFHIN